MSADEQISRIRVRVRFCETDLMGVVHHGRYVPYLEAARIEYLRRRGVDYAALAGRGVHMPVVELNVTYRRPAAFDDELDVEVRLGKTSRASVCFEYRILRAGELLTEASVRLACIGDDQRARRLDPELLDALRGPELPGFTCAAGAREQPGRG